MKTYDVIIVGAGHGGAQSAIALRQIGFSGSVAIIGDEHELPYERPPLSKEYLIGEKSFERLLIRPASFWDERDVTLKLGSPVINIDPLSHQVRLGDGSAVGYGQLIWSAGGSPRMVECLGHRASGIHTIRNRLDIDRLLLQIGQAEEVVIIGAGYIGLEAAAALTKYNKKITIVETQDRVLARVAGDPISRFFESEHRTHGVVIRLSQTIDSFETDMGVVSGVRLASGEIIPAQLVIVGIGIVPNIKPLEEAGVACSNGVIVDGLCRTDVADVFAIGDCAAHNNAFASGAQIRLESVQNANDQATLVAKQIAGQDCSSYDAVPWFWSNQYDIRLQTVGLSMGFDRLLIRGSPEARSFSVIYFRAGRPIALDCVNNIKDYVQGKALLNKQWDLTDQQWRDVSTPLKDIAQR